MSRVAMTIVIFGSWLCAALASFDVHAKDAAPEAADPAIEARMVRITAELRCLVCQNQTIADSNASLAVDLRRQVREALTRGDSDAQIVDYMTARYGDFVLYRPPLRPSTALLWFGPGALLAVGFVTLAVVMRRRTRLPDDRFESDAVDDDAERADGVRDTPARDLPLIS